MAEPGKGNFRITKNKIKFYAILLISLGITAVFLLPFCDLMYKCGCTYLWAGGVDLCNVYVPGVPHCPWCEARNPILMALPFLAIFSGQIFSIYYFNRRYTVSPFRLLVIGLLIFLILGTLSGYVFKLLDNYPHFFLE